ncbi:ATP-binding protein [Flavobacteriaceae bacterium F89]|uniref:ATP-binding protein n=1 Tax=Cerina litoralis TaxID=2874477 RepID=A0AAE3JRU0_9FLAO|nr:ATP-binding protein [Cerina litoralis]MCG2459977.1 ATP-binding protein [Cerina litoralis]
MEPKKIVITGGPGSGKTSVVQKLQEEGFTCIHEISRSITLEARSQGIPQLFLSDPLLFSKRILEGRIAQFKSVSKTDGPYVFFDRGIPDVIAYMDCAGQPYDNSFTDACKNYTYDQVFLLPPWEEIYTADNERYEDFREALLLYGFLKRTYEKYGYKILEVPIGTITERVTFIVNHLKNNNV